MKFCKAEETKNVASNWDINQWIITMQKQNIEEQHNQFSLYLIEEQHGGAGGVVINNVISCGLLASKRQHRLVFYTWS